MTAAEKIAKAIAANPDHDEEGLTQVDANWTAEVAAAAKPSRIVNDLAKGSKGALHMHPEGIPKIVFQKTHDLRHLLAQLAPAPAPAATTPAVPVAIEHPPEASNGPPQ